MLSSSLESKVLGDHHVLDVIVPGKLPEHGPGDREKIGLLDSDGSTLTLTKPGKSLMLVCLLWILLLLADE